MADRAGCPHDRVSPSHAIGAWCNDCGQFQPLDTNKHVSYFIDGRTVGRVVSWNSETWEWEVVDG